MAIDPPPPTEAVEPAEAPAETVIVERRPLWQRVVKWGAIAVTAVVLIAGLLFAGLNTQPGRDFVAQQLNRLSLASGLNFRVGRIEGSLFGAMTLRDVEVRDTQGTFATAREIGVDWRPFAYLRNHIDIRSLTSPEVKLLRRPALKPSTDPKAPLLPDIDIDIARLDVARIDIAPAVSGQRHIGRLQGSAHLSGGRAQIIANGATIAAPGVPGGDTLALTLDAVPEQNKLDIDMKLRAPANGLVTGLMGLTRPVAFDIDGKGNWRSWSGKARGTLGGQKIADLAVVAQNGRFQVRGPTWPGVYMQGPA